MLGSAEIAGELGVRYLLEGRVRFDEVRHAHAKSEDDPDAHDRLMRGMVLKQEFLKDDMRDAD